MVTKRHFGVTKDGIDVNAYTISNDCGVSVTVLDYGATLQSVVLPHKDKRIDVVLGYDTVAAYEQGDSYLGASVGRFAGRIPDAVLRIGPDAFPLTANEGVNQLHGGRIGFDRRVWNAEIGSDAVRFSLISEDGEEGFPGRMCCSAVFALSCDTLTIAYRGSSDRTTAWNPTNHGYWNLNGHDAGDARKHRLLIPAERYVPVGGDSIPTEGEADVAGTRFDFRLLREIGGAFDNSFVLSGKTIRLFGNSGIGLEVTTDCTALQFYNAQFLPVCTGKDGAVYGPFGAVCLETEGRQTERGASMHEENILHPGVEKTRTTQFRFILGED